MAAVHPELETSTLVVSGTPALAVIRTPALVVSETPALVVSGTKHIKHQLAHYKDCCILLCACMTY